MRYGWQRRGLLKIIHLLIEPNLIVNGAIEILENGHLALIAHLSSILAASFRFNCTLGWHSLLLNTQSTGESSGVASLTISALELNLSNSSRLILRVNFLICERDEILKLYLVLSGCLLSPQRLYGLLRLVR